MTAQPIKILLIDDDRDSFLITEALLSQVGIAAYDLEWAGSYNAGLEALRQGRHSACLLDYRLGARDGLELLGQAIAEGCRIPIIVMTGQGDREVDMRAMQAGAADFLAKDGLTSASLERGLRYAIDRRRSEDQRLRDEAQRRLFESGFEAAREIQQRLLPQSAPGLPGFDIAGICRPTEATGGDFFDYVPLRDGRLGIVVADVSSHGFAPALIMAETRRVLRTLASVNNDPATIMSAANQAITEDTASHIFVTVFFAQLNAAARTLTYVGAGHEAYLIGPDGMPRKLANTSLPLGVAEEIDFPCDGPIQLRPGDLVVLLTDGFAEAMTPAGQPFGLERTLSVIHENRDRPAIDILNILYQTVRDFCLPKRPHDDITGVIVKVSGSGQV